MSCLTLSFLVLSFFFCFFFFLFFSSVVLIINIFKESQELISRLEVEKFFCEKDRDFDGELSFEELMGEETALERLFKSMDRDGDGTVTKEVGAGGQEVQGH